MRRLVHRWTVVVVVVAVLMPPAGVAAQERHEVIGQAALELIDYPWQQTGWTVDFLPGRSGFLGLAIGPERRIEIYVRASHSVTDVAHTIAHELGHVVDLTYGSAYRRREYRRIRGLTTTMEWFGCDECSDYATPAGDFAEVFEYWLLGPGDFRSQMGPPPSSEQLELLSHLFVEPFDPSVRMLWQQRWRVDS